MSLSRDHDLTTGALGWRPIETAPDDRFILLWVADDGLDFVAMAKWQGGGWYGIDDEGLTFAPTPEATPPTHWMPLPDPPT